jgi:glyoxylase-like metal-dependent hydrolase (beta-lactamase superfamily II)
LLIEQFFDKESSSFTYLIASNEGGALLIDPLKNNLNKYEERIDFLKLNLIYALDTHIHADHITGLGGLREKTGCETIMGVQSKVNCVSRTVKDSDVILFDELSFTAIYTPGHTNDSYCYLLKSETNQFLFTGDTLLIKGNGRTDFQNGSSSLLYDSLHNKILSLDNETIIYPAHDYNGAKSSSVKNEKKFNERLHMDKKTFIEFMGNLKLDDPKLMDMAISLNLECGL